MAYRNGVVSVGTTAVLIATPSSAPDIDGILIQNLGAVTLYLGGSGVTAGTTSTGGYQVAATLRHCGQLYRQRRLFVPRLNRNLLCVSGPSPPLTAQAVALGRAGVCGHSPARPGGPPMNFPVCQRLSTNSLLGVREKWHRGGRSVACGSRPSRFPNQLDPPSR
jgi:hypothetical protein